MKKRVLLIIFFILCEFSCKTPPTGVSSFPGILQVDDIGVTDAYLRLKTLQPITKETIVVSLGRKTLLRVVSSTALDTIFLVESLLPKHRYTIFATQTNSFNEPQSKQDLTITTLDTTNHNFSWRIDTLGDGNGSFLKDVAIVNDSCLFAVGEIHIKDSLGYWDPTLYNVAKWNGSRWSYSVGASVTINTIFAFSDTDVWAGTTAPYHFDGTRWRGYNVTGLFNGYATKIWGPSDSNLYMVGTNGSILHFDGTTWQKMDSGTDVNLTDVWGSPDGSIVWACGYNSSKPGTVLLKNDHGSGWQIAYDGTATELTLRIDSLSGMLSNVWCNSTKRLFVASQSGLYKTGGNTHGEAERISFTSSNFPGFPRGTRGNGVNDLTIVGDYTMIAHYNGSTWRYFSEYQTNDRHFNAVSQIGNMVVGVGIIVDPINSKGFVFRGRR